MSNLTNWAENKLADMARGQPFALAGDWTVHLLSAVSDSAHTKCAGTGYVAQTSARTLAAWAGTQGAGTTLASSGTSHATSNNALIDFGTVGAGGWNTMVAVGLFSGADLFAWANVTPQALLAGAAVSFAPGSLVFTLGLSSGASDYLANKLIDLIWRGSLAWGWPANTYAAYSTTAPSNAGGGSEPGVGGYARVAIPSTLAAWGPTQGGFSEDFSSGTGGRTSNAADVVFPAPTADQGVAGWAKLLDAAIGGNLLLWRPLDSPRSIVAGSPAPRFNADAFGITFA